MSIVKKARRHFRNSISASPLLYCSAARLGRGGYRIVSSATDLVVEGFPRSGNSFAEAAFRASQNENISLSHHTHAAANILRAVQLGKPCYVLIRHPKDACVSLVIQEPQVQSLRLALKEYEKFHRAIKPVIGKICLIPFEVATTDFNGSVQRLNDVYGTSFKTLPEDAGTDEVMSLVDQISRQRETVADGVEPYSPHASEDTKAARKSLQAKLRSEIEKPEFAPLLKRCEAVYGELIRTCSPGRPGPGAGK